jgi:hypothetical protein
MTSGGVSAAGTVVSVCSEGIDVGMIPVCRNQIEFQDEDPGHPPKPCIQFIS